MARLGLARCGWVLVCHGRVGIFIKQCILSLYMAVAYAYTRCTGALGVRHILRFSHVHHQSFYPFP